MAYDPVATVMSTLQTALPNVEVFGGYIPATQPTTQWWRYYITADVMDLNPSISQGIAWDAEFAINSIGGSQETGSVQYCEVSSVEQIEDGGWTPTRYRNVLTIEIVARPIN
jgi:hypothetical protein